MNFGVPEVTTGVSCRHLYESMGGVGVEEPPRTFRESRFSELTGKCFGRRLPGRELLTG